MLNIQSPPFHSVLRTNTDAHTATDARGRANSFVPDLEEWKDSSTATIQSRESSRSLSRDLVESEQRLGGCVVYPRDNIVGGPASASLSMISGALGKPPLEVAIDEAASDGIRNKRTRDESATSVGEVQAKDE